MLNQGFGNGDLNLGLGQKIDDILGPAIKLGVPFLAAKAFDFGDGDAGEVLAGVSSGRLPRLKGLCTRPFP